LFPLLPLEIIGTAIFVAFMTVATIGGVGGGTVAIPMVLGFFNFDLKASISIFSFSVLFTTLARFITNYSERHPEKPSCTSIDYSLVNVMMPLTLVGSMIGAYVYLAFPSLIIQILLELLVILIFI